MSYPLEVLEVHMGRITKRSGVEDDGWEQFYVLVGTKVREFHLKYYSYSNTYSLAEGSRYGRGTMANKEHGAFASEEEAIDYLNGL